MEKIYYLGNHRLVEELNLCSPALEKKLFALEKQKASPWSCCWTSPSPLALFAVADTVKGTSREAIQQLHDLGIKTLMLTGDNAPTRPRRSPIRWVSTRPRATCCPPTNYEAIEALYAKGHRVGMVGGRINDAPALARSGIGFAMAAAVPIPPSRPPTWP